MSEPGDEAKVDIQTGLAAHFEQQQNLCSKYSNNKKLTSSGFEGLVEKHQRSVPRRQKSR